MPRWPIILLIVAIFCAVLGFTTPAPLGTVLQVIFWLIIIGGVVGMIAMWRPPGKGK